MAILILPTNHASAQSSYKMQYVIEQYKVKTILLEGINVYAIKKLRDPVLSAALWCWSGVISITSGQEELAHRKAAVNYIDASAEELRAAFVRWYNPLFFIATSSVLSYFFSFSVLGVFASILTAATLYVGYFALRTRSVREQTFVRRARQYLRSDENVLLVCGKAHAEIIYEQLTQVFRGRRTGQLQLL
jgi:hypothetical protein